MGSILFIEVLDMPGSGSVQLTGKLGDVLKESVEVALSWVKAHAYELGLTAHPGEDIMKNKSIHVHCPGGAIPKDGPSAGIAHTIALISLFSGRAVPPTLAMTGEVSLRKCCRYMIVSLAMNQVSTCLQCRHFLINPFQVVASQLSEASKRSSSGHCAQA